MSKLFLILLLVGCKAEQEVSWLGQSVYETASEICINTPEDWECYRKGK